MSRISRTLITSPRFRCTFWKISKITQMWEISKSHHFLHVPSPDENGGSGGDISEILGQNRVVEQVIRSAGHMGDKRGDHFIELSRENRQNRKSSIYR